MPVKNFFISLWKILKETFKRFTSGNPIVFAAAIAFFTIFSLPPILIIIVNIAGKAFGNAAVEGEVANQISDLVGPASAVQIQEILKNASLDQSGFLFTIIGLVILVFSATVVFNFIQKALNSIWSVKPKPQKGVLKFAKDRLISFSMVVSLGFLMLVSLLVDAIMVIFSNYLNSLISGVAIYVIQTINFIISFGVVTVIFAVMFKILPDAKVKWKDVWMGAVVTAVLFNIGKLVIGVILGNSDIASTYGAAGSLAAILLWVFYSTVILLIGAEFTYVYSKMKGRTILPRKNAVNVEVKEVEYEKKQKA